MPRDGRQRSLLHSGRRATPGSRHASAPRTPRRCRHRQHAIRGIRSPGQPKLPMRVPPLPELTKSPPASNRRCHPARWHLGHRGWSGRGHFLQARGVPCRHRGYSVRRRTRHSGSRPAKSPKGYWRGAFRHRSRPKERRRRRSRPRQRKSCRRGLEGLAWTWASSLSLWSSTESRPRYPDALFDTGRCGDELVATDSIANTAPASDDGRMLSQR